jgi:transcriptional regulator with XRE-family HTH domain
MPFNYKQPKLRGELRNARLNSTVVEDGITKPMAQRHVKEILENEYGISVTTDYISKVERGERDPSIEMAIAWSKIVGLETEVAFGPIKKLSNP